MPRFAPVARALGSIAAPMFHSLSAPAAPVGDRDAKVAAAPLFDARQREPQLAAVQRRGRTPGVDGAGEAHGAREPAETPLGEMKRGFTVPARARQLASGNDERTVREQDPEIGHGDAGKIHHNLDPVGGLEHVHRRRALAGGPARQFSLEGMAKALEVGARRIESLAFTIAARHSKRIVARIPGVSGRLRADHSTNGQTMNVVQIPPAIEQRLQAIATDRLSGATALVLAGVDVLHAVGADEALRRAVAERLVEAQPLMAGFRTAAHAATRSSDPTQELEVLARRIRRAPEAIARIAVPLVRLRRARDRPLTVVTCSRSQVVERTLIALAQAEPLHVCCAESRPGREGAALAEMLASRGIRVDLLEDAAIGAAVPAADALIVGADAVSSDGFINKVGTGALAALARAHGVASFVLTGGERVVTPEVFRTLPLPDPVGTVMPPERLHVVQDLLFERIPGILVDQLITEKGAHLFGSI